MLNRTLSLQKWVSLILLTLGVALVQLPSSTSGLPGTEKESFFHKHFHFSTRALTGGLMHHQDNVSVHVEEGMNASLGLVAVFAACMLSGLAGVYFEKVLKGSNATLWIRNVQLSFFSLFPALFLGVLWKDGAQVFERVLPPQFTALGRLWG
jgi:solute carrier family 35 (UDP-sugar transporter), member A1/2/3